MAKKEKFKKGVDYIGVTCVFFCHDGKGRLLMQKRGSRCRDERGRWDCGSGSLEFGETFEQAVRREIREEYRVVPKELTFCGVRNVLRKNGEQRTHWVSVVFSALVDPKKARNGEPHKFDAIAWFDPKKLPKPLHSMLRPHLKIARAAGTRI